MKRRAGILFFVLISTYSVLHPEAPILTHCHVGQRADGITTLMPYRTKREYGSTQVLLNLLGCGAAVTALYCAAVGYAAIYDSYNVGGNKIILSKRGIILPGCDKLINWDQFEEIRCLHDYYVQFVYKNKKRLPVGMFSPKNDKLYRFYHLNSLKKRLPAAEYIPFAVLPVQHREFMDLLNHFQGLGQAKSFIRHTGNQDIRVDHKSAQLTIKKENALRGTAVYKFLASVGCGALSYLFFSSSRKKPLASLSTDGVQLKGKQLVSWDDVTVQRVEPDERCSDKSLVFYNKGKKLFTLANGQAADQVLKRCETNINRPEHILSGNHLGIVTSKSGFIAWHQVSKITCNVGHVILHRAGLPDVYLSLSRDIDVGFRTTNEQAFQLLCEHFYDVQRISNVSPHGIILEDSTILTSIDCIESITVLSNTQRPRIRIQRKGNYCSPEFYFVESRDVLGKLLMYHQLCSHDISISERSARHHVFTITALCSQSIHLQFEYQSALYQAELSISACTNCRMHDDTYCVLSLNLEGREVDMVISTFAPSACTPLCKGYDMLQSIIATPPPVYRSAVSDSETP